MICPTPAWAARARPGGFILGEGRKIEVAVGIDKTVAHARSS